MTREQAKSELMQIYMSLSEEKKQALDVLMAQAEKTCDIEKSNFDVRQYKLDTDTAYECGYNAGLQAQADGEYISRQDAIDACLNGWNKDYKEIVADIRQLPTVAIPSAEPKTGHWIVDVDRWGDVVTTVNGYRCDKCNAFDSDKDNYCPNCGFRMVEPQERSDKE